MKQFEAKNTRLGNGLSKRRCCFEAGLISMAFSFFSPQALHFGRGQSLRAAEMAATYGSKVLVVHGANAARAQWLIQSCDDAGLQVRAISCRNEPTLPDVEQALAALTGFTPDVVIALGGGSVIDFAKALAALWRCSGHPQEYLEVVGSGRALDHAPIPLIALPTTAGTGAEVTKNAVISVPRLGIKVSLRDPRMVPDVAIVDAGLMQGAPKRVVLAAALDAITQVIEPYLSVKANPMTDALCFNAIPAGLKALRALVEDDAPEAWDSMAWVSTCGGLALANSGLGVVHGFAGVIGGMTAAPHGEICGTLLPAALESHLEHAQKGTDIYARLHWVMGQFDTCFATSSQGRGVTHLREWSTKMGLRRLSELGVMQASHIEVAQASQNTSSMKGSPFVLSCQELVNILRQAH
jgi:alcohol dehydrogenase class IV